MARRKAYKSKHGGGRKRFLLLAFLFLLLCAAGWSWWVYRAIEQTGSRDEARPSDAIAVFGAAQYVGHPSPVFHARLDHAAWLYRKQIAPMVVVLGGGADQRSNATEGGVGRDYLLAQGIPYDHIIAETESVDTEQQAERLAEIARDHDFHRLVVVSDPTHLFRIAELCRREGLEVFTSPRSPFGNISDWNRRRRILHEMLSYTALRLRLPAGFIHRWMEGKEEL